MNITSAQYIKDIISGNIDTVKIVVDNKEMYVPIDNQNKDYAEILKQVKAGTLTIADAD
tara:strand:+ start:665 stop:841 length:177 start_codon:yes stop_codon:yes gene_type:complete